MVIEPRSNYIYRMGHAFLFNHTLGKARRKAPWAGELWHKWKVRLWDELREFAGKAGTNVSGN